MFLQTETNKNKIRSRFLPLWVKDILFPDDQSSSDNAQGSFVLHVAYHICRKPFRGQGTVD